MKHEHLDNRRVRRKTITSFTGFALGAIGTLLVWQWLNGQPDDNGALSPLRSGLEMNEKVNGLFFSPGHLAPEYPKSVAAPRARVNGDIGLGDEFDPDSWELRVSPHPGSDSVLILDLGSILSLPKRDVVFNFKCIEGWSQITYWGGTRFSDFLEKYHLGTHSGKAPDPAHPEDMYKYVGLATPDSEYYVGIDMKSMLHQQTLLCYLLNDKPLPMDQGYPLRLIITVKYGIKSLKRIGSIYFSDERPDDYWFEEGYDYDAAL